MKYVLPNIGELLGVPPAQPGAIFDQLTAPRMQHMLRVQRHAVHEHGDHFQDGLEAMSHELFEVSHLTLVTVVNWLCYYVKRQNSKHKP